MLIRFVYMQNHCFVFSWKDLIPQYPVLKCIIYNIYTSKEPTISARERYETSKITYVFNTNIFWNCVLSSVYVSVRNIHVETLVFSTNLQ